MCVRHNVNRKEQNKKLHHDPVRSKIDLIVSDRPVNPAAVNHTRLVHEVALLVADRVVQVVQVVHIKGSNYGNKC